ncbi:hypothetical protein VTN49DRAFT_954 [Thermomyces lanuginosus]|uniref:uncharacterized protein n=1 Tax=Thermomyces lanuginosus TaxID=5541 RepID=UPI0037437C9B
MGPPSIPTCARLYPIYHGSSVQCRRISAYRHFSGSLFPVFASRDGTAHLIRSGPINRGCGAYRPITLHYGIGLSPPPSSPPPPHRLGPRSHRLSLRSYHPSTFLLMTHTRFSDIPPVAV